MIEREMLGGTKNTEGGFFTRRGELGQPWMKEDRVGIPGRQKESLREWRGWSPGAQALTLESCLGHHFVNLITVTSATVT